MISLVASSFSIIICITSATTCRCKRQARRRRRRKRHFFFFCFIQNKNKNTGKQRARNTRHTNVSCCLIRPCNLRPIGSWVTISARLLRVVGSEGKILSSVECTYSRLAFGTERDCANLVWIPNVFLIRSSNRISERKRKTWRKKCKRMKIF